MSYAYIHHKALPRHSTSSLRGRDLPLVELPKETDFDLDFVRALKYRVTPKVSWSCSNKTNCQTGIGLFTRRRESWRFHATTAVVDIRKHKSRADTIERHSSSYFIVRPTMWERSRRFSGTHYPRARPNFLIIYDVSGQFRKIYTLEPIAFLTIGLKFFAHQSLQ